MDKQEIVGIKLKNKIHTGFTAICVVKYFKDYDQLISRDEARFMAAADLGPMWTELSNAPTIIIINMKGKLEPGPEFAKYWRNNDAAS